MAEPHPLKEEIQKAWGYNEYFQDEYDSFNKYMREEVQYGSHEKMYNKYKSAALALEQLARKIYDQNN